MPEVSAVEVKLIKKVQMTSKGGVQFCRIRKIIFAAQPYLSTTVHHQKQSQPHHPIPLNPPPNATPTPLTIPPQGPNTTLSPLYITPTNPARLPTKTTAPTLPIHATRHPLRRQHLHATHHLSTANLPLYKRHAQSSALAAFYDVVEEY